MSDDPTPALDDFLGEYDQDDNEWWRLVSGDHLNLFDEAIDRMRAAEAKVERATAVLDCRLSNHHDGCDSWRRHFKCDCWRSELRAAVGLPEDADD